MVNKLFKKDINKKKALSIIGIIIFILIVCWLLIPVCASCSYNYNNRDYQGACSKDCVLVSKWKLLLFDLIDVNLDYKFESNIMPKPL